jgi:O-antigen ligase/tetratricopeptide (TPR) repeat protein
MMLAGPGDFIIIAIFALFYYIKNEFSGLYLLLLIISYDTHLYSLHSLGSFASFYQFSFLVNAAMVIWQPRWLEASILYHLGLSFENSMMHTTGLGMQISFYAGNQTILVLAAILRRISTGSLSARFDRRHLTAYFIGLFLISGHALNLSSGYTSGYLMFFFSLIVFFATTDEEKHDQFLVAFLLGGLIMVISALLNVAIISESLPEVFRRRASAAGCHPNRLATWVLAALWIINLVKERFKNFSSEFMLLSFLLWALLIFTGARLILALALLSFAVYFLFSRKITFNFAFKLIAALIVLSSLYRFSQQFSLAEVVQNERFSIWKSALANISAQPIHGHGIMSFAFLPQSFNTESCFWILDWNYPHSHQLFLELLLWGGIPLLIAFLFVFTKSFFQARGSNLKITLATLMLTGMADFSWNTPSMTSLAVFFLFANFNTNSITRQIKLGKRQKILPAFLILISILGIFRLQFGVQAFERAGRNFANTHQNWSEDAEIGKKILFKDPFPLMHQIVWQTVAGEKIEKLLRKSEILTKRFPDYYAVWFINARLHELNGNLQKASEGYERSLSLEPRDLNGIRTARLLISRLELNMKTELHVMLLACLKRGNWGIPLLLNHPRFGEKLKNLTPEVARDYFSKPDSLAIDRFFLAKNLIEWGFKVDLEVVEDLRQQDFPAWIKDEIAAIELKIKSSNRTLSSDQLKQYLKESSGPAMCRIISELALAANDSEIAILAYQKHRRNFNFRNKNHEDLDAQFVAARAYLRAGKPEKAIFELDRVGAYDPGNPFVHYLYAKIFAATKQNDLAMVSLEKAMLYLLNARYNPFYKEGPNSFNWPEGDHWTLVTEKSLRKRSENSLEYCANKWKSLAQSIKKDFQAIKERKE